MGASAGLRGKKVLVVLEKLLGERSLCCVHVR